MWKQLERIKVINMNESVYQKYKLYGCKKFILYGTYELWRRLYLQTIRGSYSQKGEDLIIDKLLGYKKDGFYVDVGAYDPYKFSNTKRFYLKGWSGINIEPNPKIYLKFLEDRRRDINLNIGIAEDKGAAIFYEFFPAVSSTFSEVEARKFQKQGGKLLNRLEIRVDTLLNILSKYAKGKNIDFFTIDTEGFDLVVLKSNDWFKFRPKVICIESIERSILSSGKSNIDEQEDFLNSVRYKKYYDNGLNSIYIDIKNDK